MTLHKNARTCPASRLLLARRVCDEGWSVKAAAEAAGISDVAARRWVRRFRAGDHELADRSSAPKRIPAKTSREREEAMCSLRELRMTAAQIAEVLGMAHSTVSAFCIVVAWAGCRGWPSPRTATSGPCRVI